MIPREFFEAVKDLLKQFEGDDNTGVGFFIADMEKLMDEWEEENHEYKI